MTDGKRLAFIVGHYKSGSSWLANLLSLYPGMRGVRETHVFRYTTESDIPEAARRLFETSAWSERGWRNLPRHRVAKWTRPARKMLGLARGQSALSVLERPTTRLDLGVLDQIRLRRRMERAADQEEFCRIFFDHLLKRMDPGTFLVEKTPTNTPFIPTIRKMYPASKMLSIYRDGRDVVVSDQFHHRRTGRPAESLETRVMKWRRAMEFQLRNSGPNDVFCLKYEDLLRDPTPLVREILAFLELEVDSEIVEDMVRRSSFKFVTGRKAGQENKKDFVRKGIAGDWLNHFSDDEMQLFSRLAGDLLVELGYETDADWRGWDAIKTAHETSLT